MNEIGLDPGIDHIITHKIMDECKENDDKIIAYESWCGALPSPDAIDNPLLYKFSWSPRGALMALKNSVIYLENGIENEIKEENVLLSTVEKNFHKCFNFEGYYNRNSLKYKEIYHLYDAKTVIRGTIRYKGFCFLIQCFKNLKLFDNVEILQEDISWRKYFEETITNNSDKINNFSVKYNDKIIFNTYGVQKNDFEFYQKLVYVAVCQINDEYLLKNDVNKLCTNFLEMLNFLNFSDYNLVVKISLNKYFQAKKNKSKLDNFALLLEEKLVLQPWEKDLVFMQNTFDIELKNGKIIRKNYNLVLFGNHNNLPYSATALTVAYPAAIASQVI